MHITLTLSTGQQFGGTLYDNPVSADLAGRLPVTLTFTDFHHQEKVATIRPPLTVSGVPEADAPGVGEIGYYAPSRGIVLYYDEAGQWPGLVRLGTFDLSPGELKTLPDGFTATLTAG